MIIERRQRHVAAAPADVFAVVPRHRRRARLATATGRGEVRGAAGPAGRRRRHAPRAPRPARPARGRRPRLLARRGGRAGPAAAAARGDEGAGPGLAAVRDPARRRRHARSCRPPSSRPRACPGLLYWYALYPVHGADILGYDCRAGRRGQPAGSPPGRRFIAVRDRSPSRQRRAVRPRRRAPEEERCLTGSSPRPRAATDSNPFQSVMDFFKSPTWHFITLHVLLPVRRALARLRLLGLQGRPAARRRQDRPRGVRAHRPRVRSARPHRVRHRAAAGTARRPSTSASSRCR